MHRILVIDDEKDICMLISGILEDEGYDVKSAHTSQAGYALIKDFDPDLVIQDIWLQGSDDDGIDVLRTVKKDNPNLPFLMISGHGTIETAVSSIKEGAYDFIEKPFKSDRLILMINRALESASLKKQNIALTKKTRSQLIDLSKLLPDNVLHILDKCKNTNSRVLISGEVGAGKSIAAEYLHYNSEKSESQLTKIDCVKTNFSEFLPTHQSGTLVLEEVHHLNLDSQSALLEFLQTTELRIISTTTSDLKELVEQKKFREDLYYRLNVVDVFIPPLRTRKKEFQHLIQCSTDYVFSDMAMAKILSYQWPGNIKQLQNMMEWISIMNGACDKALCVDDLPPELNGKTTKNIEEPDKFTVDKTLLDLPLREARESFERYYLLTQVNKFSGNISKTAEFIGMERSALHRKLKSLEVFSDDHQNVA